MILESTRIESNADLPQQTGRAVAGPAAMAWMVALAAVWV